MNFNKDIDHFERLGFLDNGIQVYTKVFSPKNFKNAIKVVMLVSMQKYKGCRALLHSTDNSLAAMKLVRYYKAHSQIDFSLYTKKCIMLTYCQSRRKEVIHTNLEASLVALDFLKLENRQTKKVTNATMIPIANWKRKKFNQNLMEISFEELGLNLKNQKTAKVYNQISDYSDIAA